MRAWLESHVIATLTAKDAWPTAATAALWKRFRDETLTGAVQRWRRSESHRALAEGEERPHDGTYRVEIVNATGDVWICTPDYHRLCRLRGRVRDARNGFYAAKFKPGDNRALIQRFGYGRAEWQDAGA